MISICDAFLIEVTLGDILLQPVNLDYFNILFFSYFLTKI